MNTSPKPLVSVVLCTYNRSDLIGRAIESVLRQSFTGWELIVLNDGSTDGTEGVVQNYMKRDGRIRYIPQKNSGLARSRNNGMNKANGTYFSFIDDDDEFLPDHIEKRVRFMQENPGIDILWGGLIPRGPEAKHYVMDMERPGEKIHVSDCFVSGTLFGKVSVFRELGGFREIEYAEDYDFMKRAQERYMVRKSEFPTYVYYTDSPNRMSDLYSEGSGEAIEKYRKGGNDIE
jgi:glycosyltransferase involved in cell wall biosynthesis